jgi:hypothetical protein
MLGAVNEPQATRPTILRRLGSGDVALLLVAIAWIVVLTLILCHRVFVSQDTISNYAHIWYVNSRLGHGHGIPFRMPVVGHGQAFAFPYGFVPWLSAALLWGVLGPWVVTLWIVVGFVGLVAAMFWALPELRTDRWRATAALANPALVIGPIAGQLPFLWAAAALFLAIGLWRRDRPVLATIACAVAQITHVAIVGPIALTVVALRWRFEARRRSLLFCYAAASVVAVPAALIVFASPAYADTTIGTRLYAFVMTYIERGLVVAVPCALVALPKVSRRWIATLAIAAAVSNFVLVGPYDTAFAWRGLVRTPDESIRAVTDSAAFRTGDTYRVLQASDGKVAMYEVLRQGGRLDSEFFPESIHRTNFADVHVYSTFLQNRHVDFVVVFSAYDRYYKKNEHALLDDLVASGPACHDGVVGVSRASDGTDPWLYQIDRSCLPT